MSGCSEPRVPVELGGDGATIRELAGLQRTLGHYCGATALASAMHQHVTCFTAWRYRRGLPGAEATLRRIADEQIVLVSTGGGDFTHPSGEAVAVDGGYRVSGRKRFVSQSSSGTVMSTMFTFRDPERGMRVLNMAVPLASEGVVVADNWDVLGMRGTASDDVVLDRRVRAAGARARRSPVWSDRSAAAGHREHRLLDHLGCVPRRGRGRVRGGADASARGTATTRPCSGRSA